MRKKVTCNGCFDGLHPGHLFFLGYVKSFGDVLIVGINSDEYIRNKKRKVPYFNECSRKEMLLTTGIVDEVIVFNEDIPNNFISVVSPDVHCTGEENRSNCPEKVLCNELNIRLVYVPRVPLWATSNMSKEDITTLAKITNLL